MARAPGLSPSAIVGQLSEVTDRLRDEADNPLTWPLYSEPRWLSGLDAAELSGVIGARFRDLARHDPAQARHAVDYIGRALELCDPARVRNRSFDLIGLARAYLITGDPDRAAGLISEALPAVSSENPGRLGRKLGDWSREAARFASVPAVRTARGQVAELIGAGPRV
jgi:hypothetical protein